MPQSFAGVYLHLIFSTKNRERSIHAEWAPRLYEYIGGILRERKCQLLTVGGVEDHLHLLVSLSREITLATLVRDVKSVSSHWVHQNIAGSQEFAWQQGYAVFSVSQSALDDVKTYIADQVTHHRRRTFQEELLIFLEKHGMSYDERYLWD